MFSTRLRALLAGFLLLCPCLAIAQSSPATQADIKALQDAVRSAQMNADNAWMLVSSALVLLMTGPGLALFYGGLVRRKNILGTMMQSFAMMGLVTILWAVLGYSLAFAHGTAFIGGFEHLFLRGVGLAPNPDYAATIPEQTYMVYQLMFAIITPALITGAFAERMKFSGMAVFLSLWSLVVYSPMAHMVWGVGGLLNATGNHIPSLDFAGGTVVHVTSGVAALVTALYLGKRIGYPHTAMPPHSMVLSFIGACLLWVGWFGFNAGSALASGPLATSAFINTHFAAASAAVGWTIYEWFHSGKPTALGAISGAVAGLVAITPASGYVQPFPALLIGLIAGLFCSLMVFKVKAWFRYDDSLDAFGVHGAGGTLGAILTGLFATKLINPAFGANISTGAMDGHWGQILNQTAGVAVAWVLSAIGTLVLLFLVDKTIGLRVSAEAEMEGLDLSQHGEEGYDLNS
ncbi:ammonium transporter [Occallatibacter savannae]|uniref:ammonium transporter n=1 Tax=Occallatibacter savannae TaxID=1002691 RepID=UPI000D69C1F2|nr:ammonium transporter [Occallatibacter savannae]